MPATGPDPAGFVCLGVIGGAHGLKGDVWVKSFTAATEGLAAYGPVWDLAANRRYRLRVAGGDGERVRVHLDGVDDRTAAEALKGRGLYVPRTALPAPGADEFYHVDLIGLAVLLDSAAGDVVGHVAGVHDFGAGPVLEIARPGASTLMVSFSRETVPVVDVQAGHVVVAEFPGLFEDPDRPVDTRRASRFCWEPGDIEWTDAGEPANDVGDDDRGDGDGDCGGEGRDGR